MKTVTPKVSNVTLNCSIKTGEKVTGMTWQDLEKHLSARDGLFLQQIDSTDGKPSCGCFLIKYASKHFLIFSLCLFCERFGPRSHFKSRLSLIVRVNVVLNRTVVVDSDLRFDNLCGSHLQSQSELYHVS